jgi:hypothetical protein
VRSRLTHWFDSADAWLTRGGVYDQSAQTSCGHSRAFRHFNDSAGGLFSRRDARYLFYSDDGLVRFHCCRGQGGAGKSSGTIGGGGAVISGDPYLTFGEVLTVLAGGAGLTIQGFGNGAAGSGGGMSFIALGSTPIIVAGGGGGSGWFVGGTGGAGQIGTSGQSSSDGAGGVNGQGGQGAAAGAGWLSAGDGGVGPTETMGGAGLSGPTFAGGAGYIGDPEFAPGPGTNGGIGGGGGGGYNCGAGGDGYSGGGGNDCSGVLGGGGGGGSYISPLAFNVTATAGGNVGTLGDYMGNPYSLAINNGFVDIDFVSAVPEPSTWAMMFFGFFAVVAGIRRTRRRIANAAPSVARG